MKNNTPQLATHLIQNPKKYLFPFGVFLRKNSLDEIPQLFSVLIGQMSLVGPRPALFNQYDLINQRDNYNINDFKPGISGYAQINGRDGITIDEKVKLDSFYVSNQSFFLDTKILFLTLLKVFKSENITH